MKETTPHREERDSLLESKVYLSIQDVETMYSLKASFQAKYRTIDENPIPYKKPGGSNVVLYNRAELEAWIENFDSIAS